MLVKSKEALAWMQAAELQVPASARQGLGSKERPVIVSCWVRYASRRPDLNVELILDLLGDAGVISNDRWVYETHIRSRILVNCLVL
jgi:hypothetical protein